MVLNSYILSKALSIIVTFNHNMIKCYTLKSTFTNADKCKKKCYFMYIYISLSSGKTATTDFMVYGNKGLARED